MAKKSRFSDEKMKKILEQFEKESKLYDYRTKDYAFELIYSKYGDKEDPEKSLYVPKYQRDFVWKPEQQSKFIESVLLGVPLTPFLVSQHPDTGRLEIIDGSQRIRTLIAFYDNVLKLKNLEKFTEIEGAKYSDLPLRIQKYLENKDYRIIVVNNAVEEVRMNIFERINTTSEKLTDSEIRKGSYSGWLYNLILELKDNLDYRQVCPISKKREKRGEYEELILRFFTYTDRYKEFKHDVANFLNDYLSDMNERDFLEEEYRQRFINMITFIQQNFQIGFRKDKSNQSIARVRFEAIAVGTYLALKENENLVQPNMEWLTSDGFKLHTTTDGSNNTNRLQNRIEFVRDGLLGKLDENRLQNG